MRAPSNTNGGDRRRLRIGRPLSEEVSAPQAILTVDSGPHPEQSASHVQPWRIDTNHPGQAFYGFRRAVAHSRCALRSATLLAIQFSDLRASVTRNLLSDRLVSAPMQPLVLVPASAHPLLQRLTCLPFS